MRMCVPAMQLLFELPPKLVECFHGASLHGLGKARAARLHQVAQVALGGRQPMLLNGNHNHNHTQWHNRCLALSDAVCWIGMEER